MELGLLIIRLAVGLTLAAHGAQKLFGIFGGHGLAGTGAFFEAIGFRPGKPLATLAGIGEVTGGLALALGLFTPFGCALVIATMIVAVLGVHLEKGFFAQNGGYEFALVVGLVAAGIAFAGPGALSFDAVLGLSLVGVRWGLIAIALGLVGALPPLLTRAASSRRSGAT
jgi:putative oxidoreductase